MVWKNLIPLVVRYLLARVVKGVPMENWKAEAKKWVFAQVPGSWADELAWGVVEAAWDLILAEVLKQVPGGLAEKAPMNEAWSYVAHISAEVIPAIESSKEYHEAIEKAV